MKFYSILFFSCFAFSCNSESYEAADDYAHTSKNMFAYKGQPITLITYKTVSESSIEKRYLDSRSLLGIQEEFKYLDKHLFMGFFHDLDKHTGVYGVYELSPGSKKPKLVLEGGYLGFSFSGNDQVYAVVNPSMYKGESSSSVYRFELGSDGGLQTKKVFSLENSIIANVLVKEEGFLVSGYKYDEPFASKVELSDEDIVFTDLSIIEKNNWDTHN